MMDYGLDLHREKPLLIAEVGQAHEGSLGMAHAYIDAVADSGADAVKFQTHIASAESTLDEPFRVQFSRQDPTRYAYWRRMEFSPEQWLGLANHARERGLYFLSSPFSLEAVSLLADIGVSAWKIGSGEALSYHVLDAIFAMGGPIIVSTGMSPWNEIDRLVDCLNANHASFALMQCTSRYPTPFAEVGLNVLEEMRARYHCPVGLSDHSGSPYPALAALAQGAKLIEVHVTFDRRLFGPDITSSVTFDELSLLVKARDAFVEMNANPVNKDGLASSLTTMRTTFGKSVAPVRDLPAGTVLERDMLTIKKPASGIPAEALDSLVGRRLLSDASPQRLLQWKNVNE